MKEKLIGWLMASPAIFLGVVLLCACPWLLSIPIAFILVGLTTTGIDKITGYKGE